MDYPMWRFEHTFEEEILPTRKSIDLVKTFTSFPLLTLLFLSYLPEEKNRVKKILYIIFWTIVFGLIEKVSRMLGMISYHHGWNLIWSLVFDFAMFSILAIHYKRPILAIIISMIFSFSLWKLFGINFTLIE
nr:CBO0543 family protein [Bacillus pinisoli]